MVQEVNDLPEGWSRPEEPEDALPMGWKVATPEDEDERARLKVAESFATPKKTKDELKAMTLDERMQYMEDLKTEREFISSKAFVKGAASGLTFGASENIDALKPEEGEFAGPAILGQLVGSYLPLSKLVNVFTGPAVTLASKSPVLARQATALAEILGMGAAGASVSAIESLAKGEMPSDDDMLDHGLAWGALDAGLKTLGTAGKFTANLLGLANKTGKSSYAELNSLLNEARAAGVNFETPDIVAAKAMEILEQKMAQAEGSLAGRVEQQIASGPKLEAAAEEILAPKPITVTDLKSKKVSDESVAKLIDNTVAEAKPVDVAEASFEKEAADLENTAYDRQIDSIAPRTESDMQLGNMVRQDIEATREAAKAEYRPLYKRAEAAAEGMIHTPQLTGEEAKKQLLKILRLKTKPSDYTSTIKTIETALEDAGYIIQKDSKGVIEQIVSKNEVLVYDTMELAKRLNKIANYETIEPGIKDVIKTLAAEAKKDIRNGLKPNPDALAAFELAEEAHASVSRRYGRDSIRKIRQTQAGERITKMLESPSVLEDLRSTVSPKQMKQIERELLEKLKKQPYDKAKSQLRELKPHLSPRSQQLAEDLVAAKNPLNPGARRKAVQEGVLDDLSNSLTTGQRPEKTLKLWQTQKGQNLVKDALKNNPNREKLLDYVEKQSFNDLISSVLKKDGKLDVAKLKDLMKNPSVVENIRLLGGEDAVNFFKTLDVKISQLERNASLLEKLPSQQTITESKEQLKRFKERLSEKTRESKIGKSILKPKEKVDIEAKQAKIQRGEKILDRMARKDYPTAKKIDDWSEYVKETLGLNAKTAMSVFGIAKVSSAAVGALTFGIPTAVTGMVAYKMFNKMITNPRVRQSFINATKKQANPVGFIIAIDAFGDSLEDVANEPANYKAAY